MPAGRRLRFPSASRSNAQSSRRTSRVANGCGGAPRRSWALRSRPCRSSPRRRLQGHRCLHGRDGDFGRSWLDNRLGRRRRRGRRSRSRLTRREQRQRIHIAAGIVRSPDPELDVRLSGLRVSTGPDRPDRLALRDTVSDRHDDRTEVGERDGPAVGRPDRDGLPVRRQRAGEAHSACRRYEHSGVDRPADVDSPMARRRVLTAAVVERTKDLALGGPRPGLRPRRSEQDQNENCCCQSCEHRGTKLPRVSAVVKDGYSEER